MRVKPDTVINGFDSVYYTLTNSDVAAAGADPLTHFNTFGWQEGRAPNGLFDISYYLAQYPDIDAANVNPLSHYYASGAAEGRDPSAGFDTSAYLATNPDVAAAKVNPLQHFLQFGAFEGRSGGANPTTGTAGNDYLIGTAGTETINAGAGNDFVITAAGNDIVDGGAGIDTVRFAGTFLDYTITFNGNQLIVDGPEGHNVFSNIERFSFRDVAFDNRTSGPVDEFYYYALNRDVYAAGVDAAAHYAAHGWKEGRDPNPYFDTDYYLAQNPDVAAAGVNPLTHYLTNGWREGRNPSANFDTTEYLAANPDVAAAGVNPLLHYLQFGLSEGRPTTPNTAPTITSDGGGATALISIAENTSGVTTVTASDAESGTALTYSKAGGADAALFDINASTGALTFVTAPNFESPGDSDHNNSYQVVVRASDGSLSDDQTITVTVTDANDAPAITSNGGGSTAAINVAENNTAVTTVTATDQDGATPTYSINGGADAARFSINSSTGALTFLAAPNYESPNDAGTNNTYEVIVRASDGTLTDDQTITITVTDANDIAPVFSSGTTANAAENGTAAYTAAATDADGTAPNRNLSYSLGSGGDNALFDINATTGVVTFKIAPNFESPADGNSDGVYDITVNVTDGVHPVSQNVAITVTNVNETPAITSNGGGASAPITLAENTTAVTTVAATDPDGTTPSYSISGGADAARFTINSSTGVVTFVAAPNYESPNDADTNNTYQVIVRASDGTLTDDQTITVTVTDANDNAPIFSSAATANAPENGAAAYTAVAADADPTALNNTITYSLAAGGDNDLFNINSSSGVVTFKTAPNHETPSDANADNVYNITVHANDGPHDTPLNVAITVTDVNDNTPTIISNGGTPTASVNVAENTTAVTTVAATDLDSTAALTYSISGGADQAKFTINSSTGALAFASAPNFEGASDSDSDNIYNVTVQVSDGVNSDTQAIAVTVTDVNEGPTITAAATYLVGENNATVAAIAATDEDSSITFTIAGGADMALFQIDPNTGDLSFVNAPDFETPLDADADNDYEVIVRASDGLLHDDHATTITVTDANEAPTQITLTAGQIEPISGLPEVDENSPVGTVVASLSTTDADAADASPLAFTYTLLDDAGGLFKIVGDQLQVAGPIDYETNPDPGKSYDVVVQVTDSAGNQYGQTFTIKIGDATEITGADGYLAGATIFSDTNNNLFHDVNEESATSDQYGNFTFTPGSGNIVLSNGFDIAKGTFFNSVLVAPSDATVISPLTTLVAAYMATPGGTEADANTAVVAALGLDSGLDLPNYDPILASLSSDGPTAAHGAAAVRAAIMVQDTINMATAVLFGAGAASREVAGFAVAKAITNSFGSFDLTDDGYIESVINAAATSLSLTLDGTVVSGAADVIAASNDYIAGLAPADNTELLQSLTQVGKVGDSAAAELESATAATIAGIVDSYTDNTGGNPNDHDLTDKITGETFADVAGANGDNILDGTSGPDFLDGLGGNDTLNGLAGADVLDGGDGNDIINAGTGKDLLIGGPGDDFLDGGAWYNSFDVTGAGDVDRVSYANALSAVTVDLGGAYLNSLGTIATAQNTFGGGTDTIIHVEGIIGSDFGDFLYGGGHDFQDFLETFRGGSGDDFIDGRSGNDRAEYNDATAGISVNLAAGTVNGIAGGVGTDTLRSVEDIRGSAFDDIVDATGFSATSTNAGSKGTFNNFRGGDGDDTLIGNGDSQLDYFDAPHGVTVNLTDRSVNSTTGVVHGGAGVGDDTFSGVNRVRGSLFADTLIGGQVEYSASGKAEFFEGLAGDDFISGGSGFDYARYIVTTSDLTGVQVLNPVTQNLQTVGIYVNLATGIVIGDALNFGTDTLRSVEGIVGSLMDDIYDATGFGSSSVNAASAGITINEFDGGAGNDTIIGNGSTRISYTGATSGVTIDMSVNNNGSGTVTGDVSVGTDTFSGVSSIRGSAFADQLTGYDNATGVQIFDGRGGADIINGRGGFDRVVYNQDNTVTHGITVTLSNSSGALVGSIGNNGEVGNDQLSNIESITGTNFADILTISSAPAPASGVSVLELEGAGGDDTINGFFSITSGVGTATRLSYNTATAGIVVTFTGGGSGSGGNAGDIATGVDTFTGIRDVLGGLYNDIITGRYAVSPTGIDNQNLMGGSSGGDVLEGGSGNDILWGGDNNNNNGIERMDGNSASGFDDLDYASYAGASGAVTVNLFTGNSGAGFITGTNQSGDFGSASGANAGNDTLINIEGVIGSSAGDTFNGGNYFFETYRGGGGNDTINGNGGLDNAEYTDATLGVTVNLGAGTVSAIGGGGGIGSDTLRLVESIWGSAHDDVYDASSFNGASTNAGSINGGTYNVFRPGDGNDTITGNGDTIVDYSDAPGPAGLTINLAPGSTVVGGAGVGTDTLVSGVNQVIGTRFADHFIGTNNANLTFEGFEGGGGDDLIDGGGGFDRAAYHLDGNISTGIVVNLAAGTVTGDPILTGTDTLVSIEAITGSVLADTYIAAGFGPGSTNASSTGTLNEFEGMAGNDTIVGNGNTRIAFYHATGAVTVDLNLTTGAVVGNASVGVDSINAVGEVNKVRGSNFNDTIMGNSFANLLEGQNGNDTLAGRGGNDTLTGGNGADTFVFANADGNDIVTDFLAGTDKIDLTAISGLSTYDDLEALMSEANGAVTITFSPGNSIELRAATGTLDIATLHAHQSDFLI